MARLAVAGISAALLWVCGCSPYGGGAFTCTEDSQCGAGGTCSEGYCSFPDPDCDSGLRYGELSGPVSNQCVGTSLQPDAAPMANCYGTALVEACFAEVPSGTQTFSANTTIDTGTDPICATLTNSTDWCVVAAEQITIASGVTVSATGTRPLVLVATGTITVDGMIDVASRRAGTIGAGAVAASNTTLCDRGAAPTGANDGGGGGSFGGRGGDGGGATGMPGAVTAPTSVRGGCAGHGGGGANAGSPGNGGGAVYLIAETSIAVDGTINASGAGATAGQATQSGGGGGGSGGMIGFDSPNVTATGNIFANGGGGGEGGTAGGNPGDFGDDPTAPTTPAAGGSTSTSAGNGGSGSAGATTNGGNGGTSTLGAGHGGGGGGAGVIKVYRAPSIGGGTISPAPS